jgi:translation initiation factor IF-3
VRLVDADGEMAGVVALDKALEMAANAGMDLVEVSPNAEPPVCKVLDYGKFRYEQQKKAQEAKKKQKVVELKELKLRPNIEDHDYNTKLNHAKKFLEAGNKVKFTLRFRGREMSHIELGLAVLKRYEADLSEIAKVDVPAKKEGRQVMMVMGPQ